MNLIELTHRIALTLHRVGLAGAAVDLEKFHELGKSWTREAHRKKNLLVRAALRTGMKEFVPTNDDHIRELLYKKLKFPVTFRTPIEDLPAVHKIALKQFEDHKIVKLLLEFNSADKLASTWYGKEGAEKKSLPPIKDLIKPIPENSRIGLLHNWINSLGAKTGRRSGGSDKENEGSGRVGRNPQNWPEEARAMIVSRWKNGKIAACDFKSLEPVLYGWRSRDEKLLDFFLNGGGYIDIAREVFGKKIEKDSKPYKLIKNNVLGIFYNEQDYKLAYEFWYKLNIRLASNFEDHQEKVRKMRRKVIKLFPNLQRYIRERSREVEGTEQVVSPTGRIRHLPHHGPSSEGFWKLKNQGINYPIQSGASDVTGSAMVDFEESLLKEHKISYTEWHEALLMAPWDPPCSVLFNEVHDELDLDMHPKHGKNDLELLVESMRSLKTFKKLVPGFDLRLRVDVDVGPTWK
jgi:DNA polymerase I-like protein with 3'-5' exonuclease and polymerase domains